MPALQGKSLRETRVALAPPCVTEQSTVFKCPQGCSHLDAVLRAWRGAIGRFCWSSEIGWGGASPGPSPALRQIGMFT